MAELVVVSFIVLGEEINAGKKDPKQSQFAHFPIKFNIFSSHGFSPQRKLFLKPDHYKSPFLCVSVPGSKEIICSHFINQI